MNVRFAFTGKGTLDLHIRSLAENTESDASDESIIDEVCSLIWNSRGPDIEIADADKAAICDAVREEIAKQKARFH